MWWMRVVNCSFSILYCHVCVAKKRLTSPTLFFSLWSTYPPEFVRPGTPPGLVCFTRFPTVKDSKIWWLTAFCSGFVFPLCNPDGKACYPNTLSPSRVFLRWRCIRFPFINSPSFFSFREKLIFLFGMGYAL